MSKFLLENGIRQCPNCHAGILDNGKCTNDYEYCSIRMAELEEDLKNPFIGICGKHDCNIPMPPVKPPKINVINGNIKYNCPYCGLEYHEKETKVNKYEGEIEIACDKCDNTMIFEVHVTKRYSVRKWDK